MNELIVVKQTEILGQQFNIYGDIHNPLFLVKEIATFLGYDISQSSRLVNKVGENEKVRQVVSTLGGSQETWFLTEFGLYETLFQSRKPIAKEFKYKIKEILVGLRTGELVLLRKELEEVKPKLEFYNQVLSADGCLTMLQASKALKIFGRNTLFRILRQNKVLISNPTNKNVPYERYIKSGQFMVVVKPVMTKNGIKDSTVTLVTPKGLLFIERLLKKEQEKSLLQKAN
jgi:phage antirepressor YoqD-like protein